MHVRMYVRTGARGSSMSQHGHTLCTPGTVIMLCKQLWGEEAHCDRLDGDYIGTCVEGKIVFTNVMCSKVFFRPSQGLMMSFYLCNPGNS